MPYIELTIRQLQCLLCAKVNIVTPNKVANFTNVRPRKLRKKFFKSSDLERLLICTYTTPTFADFAKKAGALRQV